MFQSMKLFASLAAVTDPEPGPPTAADAIRAATLGGARSAGMTGKLGALKRGMAADLLVIDLTDPSFVPLNSAARQVVFTESGRGVETVIVDGRVVVRDRRVVSIDERALREEVAELMKVLRKDLEAVAARSATITPYVLEAYRKIWATDVSGLNRFVSG
jgi:cytosine/adenosine deaminase-related metal-dependent hydrolase